jgi:hypothetical protein
VGGIVTRRPLPRRRDKGRAGDDLKGCRVEVRCTDEERARWDALALREGVSLATWIRRRLNASGGPK